MKAKFRFSEVSQPSIISRQIFRASADLQKKYAMLHNNNTYKWQWCANEAENNSSNERIARYLQGNWQTNETVGNMCILEREAKEKKYWIEIL